MSAFNLPGRPRLLAAALVLVAAAPAAAVPPVEGAAKLLTVSWHKPGPDHVYKEYGTITEVSGGVATTKLPPSEEVREYTLIFELTFDTTPGNLMPLRFDSRSGMLDIKVPPELKDGKIAASAIKDDKATLLFTVTIDPLKLKQLQPVYYEVISVYAPGTPTRGLAWTLKPWGKHDEKRPVRRAVPGPTPPSP
jgi:hypothetical protein